MKRATGVVTAGAVVFAMMAGSVLGQSAAGQTASGAFRDEKTGKVWTPETVSQDNKAGPATPMSAEDKAFDPRRQQTVVEGVTVQRPRANLMGVLPVTAGPNVPLVTLDGASLQAVPGERWLTVIYVTNNSATVVDTVVGCTFTNGDRKVEETRVIVQPAGPGERLGLPVYGPPVDLFVDRATCRVISPT
jgi:hypothetical protein